VKKEIEINLGGIREIYIVPKNPTALAVGVSDLLMHNGKIL